MQNRRHEAPIRRVAIAGAGGPGSSPSHMCRHRGRGRHKKASMFPPRIELQFSFAFISPALLYPRTSSFEQRNMKPVVCFTVRSLELRVCNRPVQPHISNSAKLETLTEVSWDELGCLIGIRDFNPVFAYGLWLGYSNSSMPETSGKERDTCRRVQIRSLDRFGDSRNVLPTHDHRDF